MGLLRGRLVLVVGAKGVRTGKGQRAPGNACIPTAHTSRSQCTKHVHPSSPVFESSPDSSAAPALLLCPYHLSALIGASAFSLSAGGREKDNEMTPRIVVDKLIRPTDGGPIIYSFRATYYDERGQRVMSRRGNTYGMALVKLYDGLARRGNNGRSELPEVELPA